MTTNIETILTSVNNKKENIEYIDTFNLNPIVYYLKVGLVGKDAYQFSNSIYINPNTIKENSEVKNIKYDNRPKWYF